MKLAVENLYDQGSANLCADVVEGRWGDNGETDQEDISLWVGEWAQSIVILLTSSIPQTQANWLPVYHNTGRVVVEAGFISVVFVIGGRSLLTRWGCTRLGRHLWCMR